MTRPNRIMMWAEALRSGDYTQGFSSLKNNNCYCVLGVACEISKQGQWNQARLDDYFYETFSDMSMGRLPQEVQQWYGLTTANPILSGSHTASALNDMGVPFDELADLVIIKLL